MWAAATVGYAQPAGASLQLPGIELLQPAGRVGTQ